jgi:hypothetical protein
MAVPSYLTKYVRELTKAGLKLPASVSLALEDMSTAEQF